SSSEISMPNSSSSDMTSSTMSSESALRSWTNSASRVTWSGSTPSCSATIPCNRSKTVDTLVSSPSTFFRPTWAPTVNDIPQGNSGRASTRHHDKRALDLRPSVDANSVARQPTNHKRLADSPTTGSHGSLLRRAAAALFVTLAFASVDQRPERAVDKAARRLAAVVLGNLARLVDHHLRRLR